MSNFADDYSHIPQIINISIALFNLLQPTKIIKCHDHPTYLPYSDFLTLLEI